MLVHQIKVQCQDLDLNFVFSVNEALVICIIICLLLSFFFSSHSFLVLIHSPSINILNTLKNVLKIVTMEEMREQFLIDMISVDTFLRHFITVYVLAL